MLAPALVGDDFNQAPERLTGIIRQGIGDGFGKVRKATILRFIADMLEARRYLC